MLTVVGTSEARTAGSAHLLKPRDLARMRYDNVESVVKSVPGVYARGEDGFGLRPNIGIRGTAPDRSKKVTLMEDGILRTRIRKVFRYPAAARELELSGAVIVRATIDGAGRLLDLRVAGPCSEGILCEDALRTIRAAAPFPPLPAPLGETLSIDVPLTYAFGGAI